MEESQLSNPLMQRPNKFVLERMLLEQRKILGRYYVQGLKASMWEDIYSSLGNMMLNIRGFILAEEKCHKVVRIRTSMWRPKGLRDYFIQRFGRFLPKWVKRKWPIRKILQRKNIRVNLTGQIAYPKYNRLVPELGHGVEFIVMNSHFPNDLHTSAELENNHSRPRVDYVIEWIKEKYEELQNDPNRWLQSGFILDDLYHRFVKGDWEGEIANNEKRLNELIEKLEQEKKKVSNLERQIDAGIENREHDLEEFKASIVVLDRAIERFRKEEEITRDLRKFTCPYCGTTSIKHGKCRSCGTPI